MKSRLWALGFAGVALTTTPMSVEAACAPANLAGGWDAYAIGAQEAELYWHSCTLGRCGGGAAIFLLSMVKR